MTREFLTERKFTPDDDLLEALKRWNLPIVEDKNQVQLDSVTNAIGKKRGWVYEEPDEEEEEPKPPTAEEIEAIRQAAHEEGFEAGKKEGYEIGHTEGMELGQKEGYEQGRESGHALGLQQGESEIAEKSTLWEQMAQHLIEPINSVDDQTEKELVRLAYTLAEAVIQVECKTNENVVLSALKDGLKVLPLNEQVIHIHMHPQDIELVKESFPQDEIEKRGWQLFSEPTMLRGGVHIVTDNSSVNNTIEQRLKDSMESFLATISGTL